VDFGRHMQGIGTPDEGIKTQLQTICNADILTTRWFLSSRVGIGVLDEGTPMCIANLF